MRLSAGRRLAWIVQRTGGFTARLGACTGRTVFLQRPLTGWGMLALGRREEMPFTGTPSHLL